MGLSSELNKGTFNQFLLISSLSVIVYLLNYFNVPVALQILGLLFYGFVPGFLIIGILGFSIFGNFKRMIYSVGMSVTFLMVVGLAVNFFGPYIGISEPLLSEYLALTICGSIIILAFINYWKNRGNQFPEKKSGALSVARLFFLIMPPVLGVLGSLLVNVTGNNLILLGMILLIIGVFVAGAVFGKLLPSKYYSIALFMISFALLFHSAFISNYIQGPDIHMEYYVFRLTQAKSYWDPSIFFGVAGSRGLDTGRYNSMLSITVLPTELSNLLQLDATWTLKIISPLIFAIVPVSLYLLWKQNFGKKVAFVSAFLFMAEQNFFWIPYMFREVIGELFFVLLFLTLFSKGSTSSVRMVFFVAFSFALIVSHYAMALIFLFFILMIFVLDFARKRIGVVNIRMVLLFSIIMFFWYLFVNWSASFDSIVLGFRNLVLDLNQFFNPSSRGEGVLVGVGLQSAGLTALQTIGRIFAYSVQILLVIGILAFIFGKIRKRVANEQKYIVLGGFFLLGLTVLVPGFALSLQVSRFYHISLIFLAPMFVIGLLAIGKLLFKRKVKNRIYFVTTLLLLILIPYFLFQTNFVYEVAGHKSWSVPLSIYRMGNRPYTTEFCYVQEADVYSSLWMNANLNTSETVIYADEFSLFNVLTSYGMVPRGTIEASTLSNVTLVASGDVIFLSRMNMENRQHGLSLFNESGMSPVFSLTDVIYTNGYSQVLRKPW